ncbi:MAG: AAA family ATPase [Aminipila sp.]
MKLLTERNNHIFVCGQTRSGKTYFTARALEQLHRPVLFFNVQDEDLPKSFITIKYNEVTTSQLMEALRSGAKIDLRLPLDIEQTNTLISHIIMKLMGAGYSEKAPIYVVIDECHLLKNNGKESAIQSATRGLKRGVRCIFITQRPALCDKTLYTQSAEQYIFYVASSEKEYLKNKGLDYDKCKKDWEKLGEYSYMFYDGFILEGRKGI